MCCTLKCFSAALYSYDLAERSQSFITTVVNGYEVVPRMTIRGLGHLLMSVEDLIDNSEDTKQNVLCCRETKIDPDTVEERQEATLLKLDVKQPGTVEPNTGGHKKNVFGKRLLEQLARLIAAKDNQSDPDEEAMMFLPGRIIHLETENVDTMEM